jgi:hypothetical protein
MLLHIAQSVLQKALVMKRNHYFKSSLVVAASGLAAGVGHAEVITTDYNTTVVGTAGGELSFDITGDLALDYRIHFAAETKPQITTINFGAGGINQIFLNSPGDDDHGTLSVLTEGAFVDATLLGGVTRDQGFLFENWNKNFYGDWGGTPAGASAPGTLAGPITGYVGLAIPTDSSLTAFNYGYAHFTIDMTQGANAYITLLDTGYESTVNQGITITAVPEPSSAALLVTGAAGLLALRRRRARG